MPCFIICARVRPKRLRGSDHDACHVPPHAGQGFIERPVSMARGVAAWLLTLACVLCVLHRASGAGVTFFHLGQQEEQDEEPTGDSSIQAPNVAGSDTTLRSEFFAGVLQRPLLQIIKPENGQVLDSGEVEIEVDVSGFELPSKLHDSRVCLGIASQVRVGRQRTQHARCNTS
jgi:hypothetical protein